PAPGHNREAHARTDRRGGVGHGLHQHLDRRRGNVLQYLQPAVDPVHVRLVGVVLFLKLADSKLGVLAVRVANRHLVQLAPYQHEGRDHRAALPGPCARPDGDAATRDAADGDLVTQHLVPVNDLVPLDEVAIYAVDIHLARVARGALDLLQPGADGRGEAALQRAVRHAGFALAYRITKVEQAGIWHAHIELRCRPVHVVTEHVHSFATLRYRRVDRKA